MQANTSKVFRILIEIKSTIRFAALSRIADPQQQFVKNRWGKSSVDCLTTGMAAAALRRPLHREERDVNYIAWVLGLKPVQVQFCVREWDKRTVNWRNKLRRDIARYVAEAYPVIETFSAPPKNTSTEEASALASTNV